ncbi:MAG TPA: tRNA pseudouridine(38-40) synthase TruA, partial [Gammaproteobacteria bacterium]|nr:tRNA pseudouridine(38-40) synthase TruA [Gammaproteobacteria bacterium]
MIDHSDSLSAGQRFALGVEYDGSRFHGWQVQSGVSTVQESLERALSRVASHPVRVITAGRTDTGVHASGQVVHFDS